MRWRFNKSFKNFPRYLGWGKFRPDENFYQEMRSSAALGQPFYGLHNEFGPQGKITRENFPHFFKDEISMHRIKVIIAHNVIFGDNYDIKETEEQEFTEVK